MVIAERPDVQFAGRSILPPDRGNLMCALGFADAALAEAEDSYEKCLAVMERCLGANHPGAAQMHRDLAYVEEAMGRPREAEHHLRRALAIHSAACGPSHAGVVPDLVALARFLLSHDRDREAVPLLRWAVWAYGSIHGPDAAEVTELRRVLDEVETSLTAAP